MAVTIEALVEGEIGRIEQPELGALARKLRVPARLEACCRVYLVAGDLGMRIHM
jgi:hypothetical protein